MRKMFGMRSMTLYRSHGLAKAAAAAFVLSSPMMGMGSAFAETVESSSKTGESQREQTSKGQKIVIGDAPPFGDVTGEDGIAIGRESDSNGYGSLAVGAETKAWGSRATALGYKAWTDGSDALAVGHDAFAKGGATTAVGAMARAVGDSTTAVGVSANADDLSTAIGKSARAHGKSIALGVDTNATNGAVSIGNGITNNTAGTVRFGNSGGERRLTGVAAGQESTDAVNKDQSEKMVANARADLLKKFSSDVEAGVMASKKHYSEEIAKAEVKLNTAIAAVKKEKVQKGDKGDKGDTGEKGDRGAAGANGMGVHDGKMEGEGSLAIGTGSEALGDRTTAIGVKASAKAENATAMGNGASAWEKNASAFGQNAMASGDSSTAAGSNATAGGLNATAVGAGSYASERGTAIGQGAKAAADALAIGMGASADDKSFALGNGAVAKDGATAIGNGVINTEKDTVQFAKDGETKRLKGVAAGTADTDAVNVAQGKAMMGSMATNMRGEMSTIGASSVKEAVKQSGVYTDQKVGEIRSDMANMDRSFRRGIASSAALMMAAPYAPGKIAMTAGTALYRGTGAVAVGASYWNRAGTWNFNGGVSTSGGDSTIFRAGASMVF